MFHFKKSYSELKELLNLHGYCMPKKLQFSQNLQYITLEMFMKKFYLLLNFASVHTDNSLLVSKLVQSII
jgi:hypothetical protein